MFGPQRSEGVAVTVLWMCMTLVLLVTEPIGSSSASNPGLKIRVSRAGLDYAANVVVGVLSERVRGIEIRDQKGSADVSIGRVEYEVNNIKVTDFVRPSSSVVLNPGSGLSWRLDGARLSLHGDWRYRYKRRFLRVRDHGSFDASLTIASTTVTVSVSMDTSSGRPTVASVDCSCTIDAVEMRVHGGASWLYGLFMGSVERPLKEQLQRLVCQEARKAVDVDSRSELDKLQVRVPVGESWLFDYRLVDTPRVDSDFIEFLHKGAFFHKNDTSEPPFQAEPFPVVETQRMVTIWISDYIAQTVGYVLQRQDLLRYHLSRDSLPASSKDFLNTTCSGGGFCFGSFLPQVSRTYPNASVEMELAPSGPPRVEISQRSIRGSIYELVTFSARLPNGTLVLMFRTNMTVSVGIAVSFIDSVLRGNVTGFLPSVSVLDSTIGTVSGPLLQTVLKTAVGRYVMPLLRNFVWKGVPLPTIRGVQLVDPRLEMLSHCLVVSTDVSYTPRGQA